MITPEPPKSDLEAWRRFWNLMDDAEKAAWMAHEAAKRVSRKPERMRTKPLSVAERSKLYRKRRKEGAPRPKRGRPRKHREMTDQEHKDWCALKQRERRALKKEAPTGEPKLKKPLTDAQKRYIAIARWRKHRFRRMRPPI